MEPKDTIRGRSKPRKLLGRLLTLASLICIGGGVYLLILLSAPQMQKIIPPKTWNTPVPTEHTALTEDRLYIPKLKINITYKAGDRHVLNDNAWWRSPERGNPKDGGNFILAAHRFELGLTPGETRYKSPFYNLDELMMGDKLYADYNGVRYEYKVVNRYKVAPNDTKIEQVTNEDHMTLYSCTKRGSADGREVVIAEQTAANIDPAKPL